MIRIWPGKWNEIQQEKFDREQILEIYGRANLHEDMKFIIKNNQKAVAALDYRDILLKRTIKENMILHSKEVWTDARDYFNSVENLYSGACVGVLDESGELLYILEYLKNDCLVEEGQYIHFFAFQEYEQLPYEEEVLEEKSPNWVFQYAEEYSIHIAKLLLKRNKECHLYFLDKAAIQFFEYGEIQLVSHPEERLKNQPYTMIISDKKTKTQYVQSKWRTTYKSVEVMMHLYEEEISKRINPHITKPFLLIHDIFWGSGLVDILKFARATATFAELEGYIPVIYITGNMVYTRGSGENIWECFFEPLNEYSVDQVFASKNFKVLERHSKEMIEDHIRYIKKNQVKNDHISSIRKVAIKEEIKNYCESELPAEFREGKKILGVNSRGTDYRREAVISRCGEDNKRNLDVNQMIEKINREMEQGDYQKIYIVTEDEEYYQRYKEYYGERMLSSKQERFDYNNVCCKNRLTGSIPRVMDGFETALNYLTVIYCLSQCESLMTSMECGAYAAAKAWKNGKYKKAIVANKE